jgi:MoaA/NifB/PqqE/SkfB family radical SAM enzyme
MNLSILYRGPLSGCNYSCNYCPFAKTKNTKAELADDTEKLNRFVDWTEAHPEIQFSILFTPWGEALIRKSYQQVIHRLSHLANVQKVAIQTNLSCKLHWLDTVNKDKVALWATYHPGETNQQTFLDKCSTLDELKISYSVGVVGFKEVLPEIERLKKQLPEHIYLWVNALKKQKNYYTNSEKALLIDIDPHVITNMINHPSEGRACKTGNTVISVDGDGTMQRCHFVKETIGNIYDENFRDNLFPRLCTNATCGCHIGYVHMNHLQLESVYKDKLLERIAR